MNFMSDANARSEILEALSNRIKERITNLDTTKEELDEDMIEYERRMSEVVDHFAGFEERRKARKIAVLSFAVGASSLLFRMNAKVIGLPTGLLSFTTALGLGSLAVTLYFLKAAWYPSNGVSKKTAVEKNDSATYGTNATNKSTPLEDYFCGN